MTYLLHFHQFSRYVLVPHVFTLDTRSLHRQVAEHDALEDGGVGRDADSAANQHGVLGVEYLPGGRAERPVDVDLQKAQHM